MPKVSIVLPVYNGARYLEAAIQSVLAQTYKDYELIIVDDGSSDETPSIAQKYADTYKNVRYIRNKVNIKLPASLNVGFAAATGEYFTWTSCDNVYSPQALEVLVNALETDGTSGLVYSNMDVIDAEGRIIDNFIAGPQDDLIYRNVIGACFLYRSAIAEKIGPYNEKMFLCEDYEYWLRIACSTKIKPISTCLYQYRRHSDSLSSQREKEIIAKGIRIQKHYYPFFVKTKRQAALFYSHLRARDVYNPFRQLYLLLVLAYSPLVFCKEVYGLIARRL